MNTEYYFASPVIYFDKPEFIDLVNSVSEESLAAANVELDEIYPVRMSVDYSYNSKIEEFREFVGEVSWAVLKEQGYAMHRYRMAFTSMWTQEHHKHSMMEQHNHSDAHIVGFYFLEVPDNSSKLLFHDPRIAKSMCELEQENINNVTSATSIINFIPRPGLLIFTNSWLSHSFTKHAAETPIKFIHFNIKAVQIEDAAVKPMVEII